MSVTATKLENSNIYKLDQKDHYLKEQYYKLHQPIQSQEVTKIKNIYILRSFEVQVWRELPDRTLDIQTKRINHCKEHQLSSQLGFEIKGISYSRDGRFYLANDDPRRTENIYGNLRLGNCNVLHVK